MRPQAVVLIGPPASGKGTHGKVLGMLPGFYHFSMGHAFRSRTPRSEEERKQMEALYQLTARGNLVPDEIALNLFEECLAGLLASGALNVEMDLLILDGIPRTAVQAMALDQKVEVRRVFEFHCPDEEILRRIRGRAIKEGRADDASVEIVQRRLEVYRQELPGLRRAYAGRMIDLDTARPAYRVLHDLLGYL